MRTGGRRPMRRVRMRMRAVGADPYITIETPEDLHPPLPRTTPSTTCGTPLEYPRRGGGGVAGKTPIQTAALSLTSHQTATLPKQRRRYCDGDQVLMDLNQIYCGLGTDRIPRLPPALRLPLSRSLHTRTRTRTSSYLAAAALLAGPRFPTF